MRFWLSTITPDLGRGLRAAIATVGPFYFAVSLERPELLWMASGGWFGSLVDSGGSRLSRARAIATFALAGGLSVALGQLLPSGVLVTAYLGLVACAATLLRAFGGGAASWGTLFLIATCAAAGQPSESPLENGVAFALGASWAVLLSSVVWPVWTHMPLRRALAQVFSSLGDYARALIELAEDGAALGDPRFSATARLHQRAVRARIEEARAVALALRSRRSGETPTGSKLRVLLEDAENQFFSLIFVGEELESSARDRRDLLARLELFAGLCREAEKRLLSALFFSSRDTAADPPPLTDEGPLALSSPAPLTSASAPPSLLRPGEDEDAEAPPPSRVESPRERLRRRLRALFDTAAGAASPSSPHLQHAVRVTSAVVLSSVVGEKLSPGHAAWVTITTVAILQPYPGATVKRAAERVVGTVLGSVTAVALMFGVRDPLLLTLALVPLSAAAMITRPRSYRWFTFFLTPVFVLLGGLGQPDPWAAWARSTDAVFGGLVALVCAVFVLPSWEKTRLTDTLRAVTESLAVSTRLTFELITQKPSEAGRQLLADKRRAVGLLLAEAETSLERLLSEPLHSRRDADSAMQFITIARRYSNSLTSLALGSWRRYPSDDPFALELRRVRDFAEGVLVELEARFEPTRSPPEEAREERPPETRRSRRVLVQAPNDAALRRVVRYAELLDGLARASSPELPP